MYTMQSNPLPFASVESREVGLTSPCTSMRHRISIDIEAALLRDLILVL